MPTVKYYHGNIYIKCRLWDVIFLSENDDGIGEEELHHSSRLTLFRMEMLNFACIN